jgi:adenylate cyclase, class 2
MSNSVQETEAKFYVRDLKKLETILQESGAQIVQARVLERNIRFDLPDGSLRSERRVLRLRRDTESRLTYKSASTNDQGVLSRTEIEFIVEDFEKARQFLEALGYQSIFYYEKYRTTYALQLLGAQSFIMLDELPFGNFVEIEGETIESIRWVSDTLHLAWDAAVATSYFALFERARQVLQLSFQDLSFENFAGVQISPAHFGVRAADEIIRQ